MPFSKATKDKFALAAVCLAALMSGLEISSVPVILPSLETVLHGDFRDMQWIMNAYTIACTTVLMAVGTLADRYGRRRLFALSVVLFGVTSFMCGLASSVSVLITGRFLQGMAGGAMLICLIAILSHQFPSGRTRARAFGAWGIVFGAGLGFGPVIGTGIVTLSNWTWVFLVHVPISAITLILLYCGVQESRDPQHRRLGLAGIGLLSAAVFGLTFFITQAPASGLAGTAVMGSAVGTICCFVAFLWIELRSDEPTFDFSVFRIRKFSGALLGSVGMNFSFWPFMIYLPLYFQNGLGYSGVVTGCALLAYTLPTLVIPPLGERLALRFEPSRMIPSGLFTIGLGFLLMRWGSSLAKPDWLSMLPGCAMAGIGLGLTNTPVTNTTTGSVTSDRAGMASGIDMSARLITLAINIALMGFILVQGIFSYLRENLQGNLREGPLRVLAERIAAGTLNNGTQMSEASSAGEIAQAALVHGFGWVMLYGALGVWFLGAASWFVFGADRRTRLGSS